MASVNQLAALGSTPHITPESQRRRGVGNYDWTAFAKRVSALMLSLDALEKAEGGQDVSRIHRKDDGETAALTLRELSITLDDGTAVVDEAEVAIKQGERVLIVRRLRQRQEHADICRTHRDQSQFLKLLASH
jgi:hypothetical protein